MIEIMRLCRRSSPTAAILALSLVASAAWGEVYKWTDSQGRVHYSDTPRHNARAVDLPAMSTFEPPPTPIASTPARNDSEASSQTRYNRFAIASPQPEATIRGNPGNVDVSLRIQPELADGDRIRLLLDGEPLGLLPATVNTASLADVERGAHTLTAQIIDTASDRVVATSDAVTFYMHRPSVNLPANSN